MIGGTRQTRRCSNPSWAGVRVRRLKPGWARPCSGTGIMAIGSSALARARIASTMIECTLAAANDRNTASDAVLITGAGGLLGRAATVHFSGQSWNVTAVTKADLDIGSKAAVLAAFDRIKPVLVINCAAATDVDRCEREPEWAFKANQEGPLNLARACLNTGAALVQVSTDYVFDGEKGGFYTQDDRPNPLSVYAKSKLAGESAVAAELDRACIVRSSWIFGKGGKNFGSRVVDLARSGAKLKGVIDQYSIPTYAPDLAARIAEIASKGVY